MPTPIFSGIIKNNKLELEEQDNYFLWIGQFEGQRIEVIVRKEKSQRTIRQNKYLWGVVYKIISDETGYSVDEIHSLCKTLFLKKHLDVGEKRYIVIGSTAKLSTAEFSKYVDDIKLWASTELSLVIPDAEKIEL